MTGREFLNSLDDKHFAMAMVAMADAYPNIVIKLLALMDDDMRKEAMSKDMGMIKLRTTYTYTFLQDEINNDFMKLIVGDDDVAEG